MAREAFIEKNIRAERLALIGIADKIVSDYQEQRMRSAKRSGRSNE